MSKNRVHAKVYVPYGISTPEICCPPVCQNWSGLPGFNLRGNSRGRDVHLCYYLAEVALMVEHLTCNQGVAGSTPVLGSSDEWCG